MNFKSLALGSVLALGSIFGGVQSAEAGTCWFKNYNTGNLHPSYCQTSHRVNANGHTVWDVIDYNGDKVTIVFWVSRPGARYGEVELIMDGQVTRGRWAYDNEGDRRIELSNGSEMAIRY